MPKKSDSLKSNFCVDKKIESFYNGGPIAITKSGDRLFTNFGNQINCIDVATGTIKYQIGSEETDNELTAFILSPNDEFLIVAYRNLLLTQYSLKNDYLAVLERTWKSGHRSPITCLAVHDNGRLLASGSSDSTVKIWDLEAQYCTHTLKDSSGCVTCVQFAPETWTDSCHVFYGDDLGKAHGRDLSKNDPKSQDFGSISFNQHTSAIMGIIFDNHFLYTCGRDAIIAKFDRRENFALKKIIPTFESLETMVIFDHNFSSSGHHSHILTGGESGNLKVWSTKSAKCIKTVKISDGPIGKIMVCQNLRSYFAATFDQMLITLSFTDLNIDGKLVGRNDEIYDVSFCGLDDSHVVVATNSNDLRVYDVETSKCLLLAGHQAAILGLDVALWDRNFFASCSKDNCILIWRLLENRGQLMSKATGHANSITAVRFSRLKPTFLASISDDHTLKLWRLPQKLDSSDQESGHVTKSDQSADHVTNAPSLSAVSTVVAHEKDAGALDISPNDKFLATGSMDKTVKIWEITEKLQLNLVGIVKDHKRGVFDVKFSPIDQVVATVSGDFTVKIFALEDFTCLKTFEGHQATVLRVNFLANGAQLISADSAGLLKLWTIKSQECIKSLDAHSDKIYALNVNRAGDRLVSGGSDARVFIWRDETLVERVQSEKEKREKIENEQKLSNLTSKKRYAEALRLALTLSRPFDAFKIVKNLLEDVSNPVGTLENTLRVFRPDQLHVLLTYLVEWNTNSRNFLIAQSVLSSILRILPPEELLKMPKIEEIVEGLTPYTERHFERLTRLRQQSYFVDFTWNCLRLTGKTEGNDGDSSFFKIKREIEM